MVVVDGKMAAGAALAAADCASLVLTAQHDEVFRLADAASVDQVLETLVGNAGAAARAVAESDATTGDAPPGARSGCPARGAPVATSETERLAGADRQPPAFDAEA